jgi:Phage-related lysozyme (muraminidase)
VDREQLYKELIRDEGFKLDSYLDSKSLWTIGVGHLLGTTKRMFSITYGEAIALLDYDIDISITLARSCIPKFDTLDEVRQRALINMAFNRGNHMKTSTSITPAINLAIESGNWKSVSTIIGFSEWYSQVGIRAGRIAYMLEKGRIS